MNFLNKYTTICLVGVFLVLNMTNCQTSLFLQLRKSKQAVKKGFAVDNPTFRKYERLANNAPGKNTVIGGLKVGSRKENGMNGNTWKQMLKRIANPIHHDYPALGSCLRTWSFCLYRNHCQDR